MTINKSQRQSFRSRLGVYLPKPVFTHGQLYVSLSRGISWDFRQIPPVLRRVDADTVASFTLRNCSFWADPRQTKKYTLTRNIRADNDERYAAFLLQIGDGTYAHPPGCELGDRTTSDSTQPHPSSTNKFLNITLLIIFELM